MKSDKKLKKLAKKFLDNLINSNYKTAVLMFEDQMKELLPINKLRDSWSSATGEAGNFVEQKAIQLVETGTYKIVIIRCQFEQAALDVQVVFTDKEKIGGLNFIPAEVPYNPPEYVNLDSFEEVEVNVGEGKWILPGTLTLPNDSDPAPGVVLVHGSGPNDRDETIGPNKIFRDLSWGLASQGLAVLRYEKCTKKYGQDFSPEFKSKFTISDEVTIDAINAVKLMHEHPAINDVYLLGHSLGGYMAPEIGTRVSLAGLIIMAGTTRPLENVIVDQYTYLYKLTGTMTDQQKNELKTLIEQVKRVKDPNLNSSTPPEKLPLGLSANYWLSLRGYQPTKLAEKLNLPVLVLQGGRDYQVLVDKDFKDWRNALQSKANVTLKLFPSLNHLFLTGEGKSTPQEYFVENNHVSEEVVNTITEWIKKVG